MPNVIELQDTVYQPLAEGKYLFTVKDIVYKADFKRIEMKLETENGRLLWQNFFLETNDGKPNDIQLAQFSRLAKAAINDKNAKSIDPESLAGKSFKAEVTHTVRPKKDNPAETVTFVNLKNYESVEESKSNISDDDLAAFLG